MGYISFLLDSWAFKTQRQLIISSAILCNLLRSDQTYLPYITLHPQTINTDHTALVSNGKMNGFLKANKLGTRAKRNRRCSKLGESQYAYSTPELGFTQASQSRGEARNFNSLWLCPVSSHTADFYSRYTTVLDNTVLDKLF
jgi:hypothetical protein